MNAVIFNQVVGYIAEQVFRLLYNLARGFSLPLVFDRLL